MDRKENMVDDGVDENKPRDESCSTIGDHKRTVKYTEKGLEEQIARQILSRRAKLSQLTSKTNKINDLMKNNQHC